MPVDGIYEVELMMPQGKRKLRIELASSGTVLSGTVDGPFGIHTFENGSILGNDIRWTIRLRPDMVLNNPGQKEERKNLFASFGKFVTQSFSGPPIGMRPVKWKPFSDGDLPVKFVCSIFGNAITGDMQFGSYANGTLNGTRVDR